MNNLKIKLSAILIATTFSFTSFASETKEKKQKPAPAFSYTSLEKTKNYGPADFKGKYLLIDFWASWCPPCNAAAPELKRLYSEYSNKEFDILGVSIDKSEEAWKNKVKEKGFKWTNIITPDEGKEVSSLYRFNTIPYFVLLDKKGNIIASGFSIQELPDILKATIY